MPQGVKPERLVAAGFGKYQPLDPATSDEALRNNRRNGYSESSASGSSVDSASGAGGALAATSRVAMLTT
jgi:hypothetical protein